VLLDRSEAPIVQRLGTRGVLTLDLDIKVVAPALHLVAAGGLYLPPQPGGYGSADMGFAAAASEPAGLRPRGLSPRERAVLDLLPRSLSNREIAAALGIAEATVKIHMRNLLRKTRARNRVELALLAARRGG
jgi:DNA-binding NarL/FixJ family response regulator